MSLIQTDDRAGLRRVLLLLPAALAGAVVAFSAFDLMAWQVRHHTAVPFGDTVEALDLLRRFLAREIGLRGYFLTPHVEHVVATTRLVLLLDWFLAQGTGLLAVIGSNLIAVALAFSMAGVMFVLASGLALVLRLILALTVIGLWLNGHHLLNLNWTFQVAHWVATLAIWIAALMFALFEQGGSPRRQALLRIGMVATAAIAVVSLGVGAIMLPVLLAAAVLDRWRGREMLWLAAASIVLLVVYFSFANLTRNHLTGFSVDTAIRIVHFTVAFVGSPFIRLTLWPNNMEAWTPLQPLGVAFGIAILAVGAGAALKRLRDPKWGGVPVTLGLVLIGTVVAAGILAAFSRSRLGLEEAANKKYVTLVVLAWVGALFILAEVFARRPRLAPPVVAALAALVLLVFIRDAQTKEFLIFEKWNQRLEESAMSLRFSAGDDEFDRSVNFRHLAMVRRVNETLLRPNRASFYTAAVPAMNEAIDPALGDYQCYGDVNVLTPVPGRTAEQSYRFGGWSWMKARRAPPSLIVVVDAANRVRGAAAMTRVAPVVDDFIFISFSRVGHAGFFGHFVGSGSGTYRVLAYGDRTKPPCQLSEFRL